MAEQRAVAAMHQHDYRRVGAREMLCAAGRIGAVHRRARRCAARRRRRIRRRSGAGCASASAPRACASIDGVTARGSSAGDRAQIGEIAALRRQQRQRVLGRADVHREHRRCRRAGRGTPTGRRAIRSAAAAPPVRNTASGSPSATPRIRLRERHTGANSDVRVARAPPRSRRRPRAAARRGRAGCRNRRSGGWRGSEVPSAPSPCHARPGSRQPCRPGGPRGRPMRPGGRRRTGASPTRSGPEGSSRNEFPPGSFVRPPTRHTSRRPPGGRSSPRRACPACSRTTRAEAARTGRPGPVRRRAAGSAAEPCRRTACSRANTGRRPSTT